MNNFERLKAMDADSFTEAILSVLDTPFRSNIDWKAYMKGESEIPTDYLFSKEKVKVLPTDAELIVQFGTDAPKDREKYADYIQQHSEVMTVLGRSEMFGNSMITVADIRNDRILKVPERFTEKVNE